MNNLHLWISFNFRVFLAKQVRNGHGYCWSRPQKKNSRESTHCMGDRTLLIIFRVRLRARTSGECFRRFIHTLAIPAPASKRAKKQ